MFRAISCSSSGGQIVLTQLLVSLLSLSDFKTLDIKILTESDDTKCCINTIWPPDDEQDISQNMYM
jgi:hypothetical protein